MPESPGVSIRKFEARDRAALRKIAHDTALMGEPASLFFEGEKIFTDALTLYFTDYEPESCLVAEKDGEVVGYLVGTKDRDSSEKIISQKITLPLFIEALKSGVFLKKKNVIFIFNALASMAKGEFNAPHFNTQYPAELHINIKKGFRGLNAGSMLITAFLDYLRRQKVIGVHLATMSKEGADFFEKNGFELLCAGKRSYFRHILKRDVPLYIYGKKLQ